MNRETRDMLLETADRFFTGRCGKDVVNSVEKGVWPTDLWKEIEEMGLPLIAVAGMMQGGKSPAIEAALVKDLGTIYQQDLPEIARAIAESDATTEEDLADFLDVAQYATMMAPSYTIQGGTTQVLRGIVARGLGLR